MPEIFQEPMVQVVIQVGPWVLLVPVVGLSIYLSRTDTPVVGRFAHLLYFIVGFTCFLFGIYVREYGSDIWSHPNNPGMDYKIAGFLIIVWSSLMRGYVLRRLES